MQRIAREMNLPETAFLISREEGFDLRWFTPEVEVELCGHATLASAHCCLGPCWAKKLGKGEMLAYQASARGGWLRVRLEGDRVLLGGRAVTVFRGELLV